MPHLVQHLLTGFLSLVYIAMGVVKLYPVSEQISFAVQFRCFVYATVFPTVWVGYEIDSEVYRTVLGVFELTSGLAMLSWDRELKMGACGILMAIMVVMVISSVILGDYFFLVFHVIGMVLLSYLFTVFRKMKQD